ncbi:hypothetical protein D9M68_18470 [compost metagenome]
MSTVDNAYHQTLDQLHVASNELLRPGVGVLFVTQVRKKLNQHYLKLVRQAAISHNLPEVEAFVQEYTCSTCSKFMARVGHLVMGTDEGVKSIYWNPEVVTDPVMKTVVEGMKRFVEEARIINLFNTKGPYVLYEEHTNLGNKPFRHFYMDQAVLTHRVPVIGQAIDTGRLTTQMDRMNTLIRLVGEVNLDTVVFVDNLFKSRVIEYVGDNKNTLEQFMQLVMNIAILKTMPAYTAQVNPYSQETLVVNAIWKAGMRAMGLLGLRSSLTGKLLLRAAEILSKGASDNQVQLLAAFWAEQTSGLKYKRTTAEASESQVAKTARFLEEGGWLPSLEQVEAAEIDIPVIWEAARPWTFEEAHKPTDNGFAAFAEKKGAELASPSSIIPVDLGYFMNEVLPFTEELGMVATNLQFQPILINAMANMDAKPIFTYDSAEKRVPFIPWKYQQQFNVRDLQPGPSVIKDREAVLPVLSITTNKAIGYAPRNDEDLIFFQFGGISMPMAPRPTLFAESLIPEFHHHRRALEDYSRVTEIHRAKTQQSISMVFGPRHPRQTGQMALIIYVRLNEEGQTRFGKRDMRYRFDANGWTIAPEFDKHTVFTDRALKDKVEAAPAPSNAGVAVSI